MGIIYILSIPIPISILLQGLQNFKIPGSPLGKYSSDFGSPKIILTSPNKKKTIHVNQKHFQYTNINKYQGKSFILLFTGNVPSNFIFLLSKTFLYWADISGT